MVPGLLLLERLSDNDLALLAGAAGEQGSRTQRAARLRERPERIDQVLALPEVFGALFEKSQEDPLVVAGPFVAFAVMLAQAPSVLQGLAFVPERIGGRRSVPVFEVDPLREFVGDPLRRLFLADLLASYTHVASGALWVRSRRGWRHRRFSELDPAQFAELILAVPPDQRLVLYRRLGDLTLFLSGVFPDHVETRPLTPLAVERLGRAVAGDEAAPRRREDPEVADSGALGLLEWVGRRSYGLAWHGAGHRDLGLSPVLGYVAEHFRHARMILNLLTDRYLFRHRERWFPLGP
jgi:hypothetical protein